MRRHGHKPVRGINWKGEQTMKELYKELYRIERATRRGLITLKECNEWMLRVIESYHDRFLSGEDIEGWDTMKAYHSMYLRLARLSK